MKIAPKNCLNYSQIIGSSFGVQLDVWLIVSQYQNQAYKALQQRSSMVLRTIQVEHSVVGDMSALTKQKYSFGGL